MLARPEIFDQDEPQWMIKELMSALPRAAARPLPRAARAAAACAEAAAGTKCWTACRAGWERGRYLTVI